MRKSNCHRLQYVKLVQFTETNSAQCSIDRSVQSSVNQQHSDIFVAYGAVGLCQHIRKPILLSSLSMEYLIGECKLAIGLLLALASSPEAVAQLDEELTPVSCFAKRNCLLTRTLLLLLLLQHGRLRCTEGRPLAPVLWSPLRENERKQSPRPTHWLVCDRCTSLH